MKVFLGFLAFELMKVLEDVQRTQ